MDREARYHKIASELQVRPGQVRATVLLLDDRATIPFIARYRKEATGSLDEVAVSAIRDRLRQLEELDQRRAAIQASLEERGLLTGDLSAKLNAAETMSELEDLYLPFRPKRRTRAMVAREKGLEPLARLLLDHTDDPVFDVSEAALPFVSAEREVLTADDALAGARDIIAEQVSEDARSRSAMRELFAARATVGSTVVKGKGADGEKYRDYFDWEEPVSSVASHRFLALLRGEREGFLHLRDRPSDEDAVAILTPGYVKGRTPDGDQVEEAIRDGYRRLLGPSMETELRHELKRRADETAIRVFAENLRGLLLAPPLGRKNVLAVDPGYRTGCKLACLDRQGKLLHHETIHPHSGDRRRDEAAATVVELCRQFAIEVIAVGNGTASRETEEFLRSLPLKPVVSVVMVNESGASIYSASEAAREEFPDQDVTVRGSVSIGRRLMDPLAELVKIDPKSIGVGQYQHDVDPDALRSSLDGVVESCVNRVGVDANTASKELLTYVSGLGPSLARSVVAHRNEHGPFASREQLRRVKGLGPKAFQQAAGFLRIPNGSHPLDASAVHPESYEVVDRICADLGCGVEDLMRDAGLRKRIVPERYVTDAIGLPTLQDILAELEKPGRDPREQFEPFRFADGVHEMEDLRVGMRVPGIITNVTAFGAFVDVGVHQDGLVHVSELADRFVRNPHEVAKVDQRVNVTVIGVDPARRRIGLSMKTNPRPREV